MSSIEYDITGESDGERYKKIRAQLNLLSIGDTLKIKFNQYGYVKKAFRELARNKFYYYQMSTCKKDGFHILTAIKIKEKNV